MDEITTEEDFCKKVNKGLVLVDFFTTWCAPCVTQGKILEENKEKIEKAIPGISMYKVDCEKLSTVADVLNIRAIPHLFVFYDGNPYQMRPGVINAQSIIENIEENFDLSN